MAKIQCKMCGGLNDLPDGVTSGECQYCGSLTTFPKIADEQTENLYRRAEHFRRRNDFDKAVAAYESILDVNNEDPEAYWGLVLSRYGIEYVEDPATHERIPTCHRVQYESILADADYRNALKFAPDADRAIYEREANRIAEIQKDILSISAQEKPYDVFICYKETTDDGTRTKDSALAQDIYYQLANQGLKVFFSRITLEDKLGQQYEPYIFAALNSAKVMLVIGSKREYFEAVWVKNEWSRFLALKKKDRSKLLIPCYRDMDPYDIPEELSMFQSQDMGRIGFIQDLLRGILKVVNAGKTEAKTAAQSSAASAAPGSASAPTAKIMKRIAILLDQQDWAKAKDVCDTGLNSDPENPELYLMMCMILRQIPNEDALRNCEQNLAVDKNFQTALKLASPERRKQLEAIGKDATFSFHMKKCLDANHVPDISRLSGCNTPLSDDPDFRAALKFASPEQKKELLETIARTATFNFHIKKSLEANRISDISQLSGCNTPLSDDADFRAAMEFASPEQKKEMKRVLAEQPEHFLRQCMERHQVSSEADLAHVYGHLSEDEHFQMAVKYALPERQRELQQIQAEQEAFLSEYQRKKQEQDRKQKRVFSILFGAVTLIIAGVIAISSVAAQVRKAKNARLVAKAMNRFESTGVIALPGGVELKVVKVEAGTFTMGEKDGENNSDEVPHQATLTKDFYIGQTEVTQAQWEAVMGWNPSQFKGDGLPVDSVTWNDAQTFCEKLNGMYAGKLPAGYRFDLPTEAQWEYAARGGKKSRGCKYSGSNSIDEVAWYSRNSGHNTNPVGQKTANELGLYDMSGNVWEWCRDSYEVDYAEDPEFLFVNRGSFRVNRGGGMRSDANNCRVALRLCDSPDRRANNIGFRLALVP